MNNTHLYPTRTTMVVNLTNIVKNYLKIKQEVGSDVVIAATIKADAYGLGSKEVASVLITQAGCTNFFLSNLDEAILLRTFLSAAHPTHKVQLYIYHGISNAKMAAECTRYNIIPVLCHLGQLSIWNSLGSHISKQLPAVLQVDTGMGRLGLSKTDLDSLLDDRERYSYVDWQYIMSEMACAEQYNHPLNKKQLGMFRQCIHQMGRIKATLANSAAIFLGQEYHFNMVRPGWAIYGVYLPTHMSNPMSRVVSIYSCVLQKRIIEQESSIGYRALHYAAPGDKFFTIEYGYVDGYSRILSNGKGKCYVHGHLLPIVGIISMNSAVVDATALPNHVFDSTTHVELLGEHISLEDVANHASDSIGYEAITAKSGNRCYRVYSYTDNKE